ncbi:Tyrosine-protein phosphatase non-receptor type 9 [Labeo rohita]|uniref:protein-tyrosine-phosphatase n=1 Tax=Labeo rohita TaxID=84645 RepID=A0ABQ8LCV2_LABRO|nr:Tyrosine-protein phosphatase non-receptor type 9 [Labeo rohita]
MYHSNAKLNISLFRSQATKQFLEEINKWTSQHGVSPLSWDVAVKFLMARKFDVLRAIELFHSYRETRLREGIVKLQPHEEPLRSELLSGKFTVLAGLLWLIRYLIDRRHLLVSSPPHILPSVFITRRDAHNFETQRNGLVFIYDMAGSNYTNFELDLSKKILNLLKVQMVKMADLRQHLPRDCLPEHLGGCLPLDVHSWNLQLLSEQNGRVDPVDELVGIPLENTSIHVPGPEAMGLAELMAHLNRAQRSGIYLEYEELRREQPPGTFTCALAAHNQERNRYGDVLCLDQTRPLEKTYGDFWRMVWEQSVLVIVMTTRTDEGGRRKCGQYWPKEEGGQEVYGHIAVVNHRVDKHAHYNQTTLELHNTETFEQRQVTHFQFLSWPDYGVPSSALSLIDFLGAVKQQQQWAVQAFGSQWRGHPLGPPMVDVGTLNVCQTVRRMRAQRAFSIQTPEQYYFCHTAILEHAQRQGLLSANQ